MIKRYKPKRKCTSDQISIYWTDDIDESAAGEYIKRSDVLELLVPEENNTAFFGPDFARRMEIGFVNKFKARLRAALGEKG